MNLLDLPQEVLEEILLRLDTKSKLVVWRTCKQLQLALRTRPVMRYAPLQVSGWSWDRAILNLAPYVSELDLSGSTGLTLPPLKQFLPLFSNLSALDLTGTGLSMFMAADACALCPHLTSFAVHFDWPLVNTRIFLLDIKYRQKLISKCQQSFRNLERMRFDIDNEEILECGHVFHVLQLCNRLHTLEINVVTENKHDLLASKHHLYHHFDCVQPLPTSLRRLSLFNIGRNNVCINSPLQYILQTVWGPSWQIFAACNYTDCAKIICMTDKLLEHAQNAPSLKQCVIPFTQDARNLLKYFRNVHLWHESLEKNNPSLYRDIIKSLKQKVPVRVCKSLNWNNTDSSLFHVSACVFPSADRSSSDSDEPPAKRVCRKISCANFNMDGILPRKNLNKVSIVQYCCECTNQKTVRILKFDVNSVTLRYITYLSIVNSYLDRSFGALFTFCRNLESLSLAMTDNGHGESGFVSVLENIQASDSIRNLTVIDINIFVADLLKQCSKGRKLEDVRICLPLASQALASVDNIVDFYKGCPKLNSLTLFKVIHHSFIPECSLVNNFNTAVKKVERKIEITVDETTDYWAVSYDKFDIVESKNLFSSVKLNTEYE